jgi:hypothetical protein
MVESITLAQYKCLKTALRKSEQAQEMLFEMLLQGKIHLSDIPYPLRASRDVYIAALRVSQHYGRFVEDVKIMMDDILSIAGDEQGHLYHSELYDIIKS